jgi:hypothetical protein
VQSINTAQVRATPVSCTSSKTIDRQTEAEMRIGLHVEALIQDIRFSFRWLVRQRAFTATALLTLALGIGSTAAVFTLVDVLLGSSGFPATQRSPDPRQSARPLRISDSTVILPLLCDGITHRLVRRIN